MRKDGEGVTISDVGKVLKAVSPLIDKIEEEKKAAYFSMLKELKEMRERRKKSAIKTKRKKAKRRTRLRLLVYR